MHASWLDDVLHRPGSGTWARTVTPLEITDSTNRVALEQGATGRHGHLVIAEAQTAGRGRWGRAWSSEPGMNLLVSFILRPVEPPQRWTWIPLAAGVAVADTADTLLAGAVARVKWPNDVRIAGRKVAGVLTEARIESSGREPGTVVVGIGLNVNQRNFDRAAGLHATSLATELGHDLDRAVVLSLLCDRLEEWVSIALEDPPSIRTMVESRLEGVGREVSVSPREGSEPVAGILLGIDGTGNLQVETDSGTRTFASGEVTLGSGTHRSNDPWR